MTSHIYELNLQRLLLLLLVLLQLTCCIGRRRINTTLGRMRGIRDTSEPEKPVNVFYGIPFAKPPLGERRFMPPEEPDPWDGVLNASNKPNTCWAAKDEHFGNFSGWNRWAPIKESKMSEDCLYLNVWIPESPSSSEPMAILVWIFGGGFTSGTSMLDQYDGSKLASMNDVIVVTFNYRVGPLGFLYTGKPDAPGNVGLLDQSMAIKWVYNNAALLGGDRSRILIFGESAGAASVGLHLFSPTSKDHYTNAMMMSGSPLAKWAVKDNDDALRTSNKLAQAVSCPLTPYNEMMECLRLQSASDLVYRQWVVNGYYDVVVFGPTVDGTFLTDTPTNLLNRNEVKNTSVIIGNVKDEGTIWLLYDYLDKLLFRDDLYTLNESSFNSILSDIIKPALYTLKGEDKNINLENFVKKITTVQYVDSVPEAERSRNFLLEAAADIYGDIGYKCPVIEFTEQMSKHGHHVFQYSFEHRLSNNEWPEWLGVPHAHEIEAFFGIPFLKPSAYNDRDREISKESMRLLTTFAKTGNPGKSSPWPHFTNKNKEYLQMTTEDFKTNYWSRHCQCFFWSKIVPLMISERLAGAKTEESTEKKITTTSSPTSTPTMCQGSPSPSLISTTKKREEPDVHLKISTCAEAPKEPTRLGVFRSLLETIDTFDDDRFLDTMTEVIQVVKKKNKDQQTDIKRSNC